MASHDGSPDDATVRRESPERSQTTPPQTEPLRNPPITGEEPTATFNGSDGRLNLESEQPPTQSLEAATLEVSGDAGSPGDSSAHGLAAPAAEGDMAEAKTVITSSRGSSVPSQPVGSGSPAEVAGVLLGHNLDHFELQTLIGGGGMGAVFRARDTRLDRTVAIKVIPRVGDDPELQRRFRNEAQSVARLDHPNIARVYDVGRHGGWHYIVFEYIEGTNLRDLVEQEGLLSVDDAVYYTRQVAEALDHAHRRGVTHRDIKPSNVLITPEGQVKLVDMGLARAQQLEMSDDMTASGVTLGTFDYISPEQARDPRDADVRSDIYSLGCTLYFALTGRPPYVGGTVLQKLLSHGSSPPPDPRALRNGLSEHLVAILHKMLAKQPQERYRRPIDLIADLYQLAERENLPRALSAGSITLIPENRFTHLIERHLPWLIAVTLLVISTAWLQLLSSAGGDLVISPPQPPVGNTSLRSSDALNSSETNNDPSSSGNLDADSTRPTDTRSNTMTSPEEAALQPPRFFDVANTSPGTSNSEGVSPPAASTSTAIQPSIARIVASLPTDGSTVDENNRRLFTSLESALVAAREDSSLKTIEIGVQRIRCGTVQWPRRELTLRGERDAQVIEFISKSDQPLDQRLTMINLGSASVNIERIHLVWTVPVGADQGGSLFRLGGGNTVRLTNASVTIVNPGAKDPVRAFEMQPDLAASALAAIAPNTTPPLVAIQLKNAIIRGQMSLLGLDQATLVELLWDNGLLAIGGNMIESAGAAQVPSSGPFQMRLSLNDVTVAPGASLVAITPRMGADKPIIVDREANRCVFSLDEGTPLIRLQGYSAAEIDRYLILRGRDNYYDSTEGRTQIVVNTGGDTLLGATIGISRLLSSDRPTWIQEVSPQGIVVWSESPRVRPASHLCGPTNYRQEGVLSPGFRRESLPSLPIDAPPDDLDAI